MYPTSATSASIVDVAADMKIQLAQHRGLPQAAMMSPDQLKLPMPSATKITSMTPEQLKMVHSPAQSKTPTQGWFLPDDKWGRFRYTKGAAKKGCMPTGSHPVWYCSKCKEEGKDSLLPLSEFMPYGPNCGDPNDKDTHKIWSRYMLSGCVYLCKRHADQHISFMKQRREEVAKTKKEEMEQARQAGPAGADFKRYRAPKKMDLSLKKLNNTLTSVLKKFAPKASIAVLMSHEDDQGQLASFHVGNNLDSFCSDAYVRSLFLLCGSRNPQNQMMVMNQGHDLLLQQMQNLTKQYGLLVRQLQNFTRQQQVQNISKQYGLIVSQLQNVARNPGVLEASVARQATAQAIQGVHGVPTMAALPQVPGMHVGVDPNNVSIPQTATLSGAFVPDGSAVAVAEASKQRDAKEHKIGQPPKELMVQPKPVEADKHKTPGDKRPRDDSQAENPSKRQKP